MVQKDEPVSTFLGTTTLNAGSAEAVEQFTYIYLLHPKNCTSSHQNI